MTQALLTIRIFFLLLCLSASGLVAYSVPEWHENWGVIVAVGGLLGVLMILVDQLLRGFSLRGFSSLTFGIFVGWIIALMISNSPFFDIPMSEAEMNPVLVQNAYLLRLALFVVMMYLGAVVALRAKDEFNLVIPYVRFEPHGVQVPLVVVDTSALIDGRILTLVESKFLGYALVVPRFVIEELHGVADSNDPLKRARGRKGIAVLNRLRQTPHLDLRIDERDFDPRHQVDAKLIFLAQSLKAKLLTVDYNLSQIATFHGVDWLNLNALTKSLQPEVAVGEHLEVELVKPGREPDQGVAFLADGTMVVVRGGRVALGKTAEVEVESIVPSAGGRMVFANIQRIMDQETTPLPPPAAVPVTAPARPSAASA